ncbi:hypothetical protein T440DRAFT_436623, partial [Plenodomus tracheiphilus IPT5]
MATPWPQQPAWPPPFREHATRLSTYLQDALTCIDRTNSQPVPADLVKIIIHGTLTFILKVQHTPDLNTVCDALRILQTETKTTSETTTQREVVVNIRDPSTIQSLRAMNPRNLKAHVERAIAQSGNENIANIKILSSNQLKSGDLSIKTATSSETEALKQFADSVHRIGHRATVRIPTYGVLAHSI